MKSGERNWRIIPAWRPTFIRSSPPADRRTWPSSTTYGKAATCRSGRALRCGAAPLSPLRKLLVQGRVRAECRSRRGRPIREIRGRRSTVLQIGGKMARLVIVVAMIPLLTGCLLVPHPNHGRGPHHVPPGHMKKGIPPGHVKKAVHVHGHGCGHVWREGRDYAGVGDQAVIGSGVSAKPRRYRNAEDQNVPLGRDDDSRRVRF